MNIIESSKYKKSYKKIIIGKHLDSEKEKLSELILVIQNMNNLQSLMNSKYQQRYSIRQKEGNLKEYKSASLSQRVRLIIKPIDSLPYNYLEIEDIVFVEINDDHYKNM